MPKVINAELLLSPYNWLVIGLIAGFWLLLLVAIFPQPGDDNARTE